MADGFLTAKLGGQPRYVWIVGGVAVVGGFVWWKSKNRPVVSNTDVSNAPSDQYSTGGGTASSGTQGDVVTTAQATTNTKAITDALANVQTTITNQGTQLSQITTTETAQGTQLSTIAASEAAQSKAIAALSKKSATQHKTTDTHAPKHPAGHGKAKK
jgi:hypothetical protein